MSDLRKYSRRVLKAIEHVRNQTLTQRIRWGWYQHKEHKKKRQTNQRQSQWEEWTLEKRWIETRIQSDIKLRLYFDSKLSHLIYCDDFEWQERQFLNTFLRPGDVFVDVGASIGLFSVIAGRIVGKTGSVYAFEPCKKSFERLAENVAINKLINVSPNCVALSDQCGKGIMTISLDGYDAWNSLGHPTKGENFETETVETLTWDEFSNAHGLDGKVALMKMDVEGWETRVLSGGKKALNRPDAPVLQVEFTDEAALNAGSSCDRLYRSLTEMGYIVCFYDAFSYKIIPDRLRNNYPYVNLIATKDIDLVNHRIQKNFKRWWRFLQSILLLFSI